MSENPFTTIVAVFHASLNIMVLVAGFVANAKMGRFKRIILSAFARTLVISQGGNFTSDIYTSMYCR
jgi:hypothetical protein